MHRIKPESVTDSNIKETDSQEKLEILIETNLNDKLREILARKLGEELIFLSDVS